MPSYKVTVKAKTDLLAIGRFTEKQWGIEKRRSYLKQLDACFSQRANNPRLGAAVDFIVTDYRKFPHGSHLIFYKLSRDNIVEIIRVLHKSMDVESKL